MAAAYPSPVPAEIEDPVTYEEASALLARTGHDAPVSTLRRWVREDQLDTVRRGRAIHVSWSDVLDAHGRRTAAKLRASSNWP